MSSYTFARGDFLAVDGGARLFYETAGDGQTPVVFVPGAVRSSRVFAHQLAHFRSSTRFRAITLDSRAQGHSTGRRRHATFETHGHDLHRLFCHLELYDAVLVGWSSGVVKALSYVHQFGASRLKALVVADGAPCAFRTGASADWKPIARPGAAADVDYSRELAALHRVMPLLFAVRPDVLDDVVEWAATFAPAADIVTVEQPLFWEHADELNAVLDRFLARLT